MNLIQFLKDNYIVVGILVFVLLLGLLIALFNYKTIYKYYKKYEEIINYLIMGVLTTVVSLASYAIIVVILKQFIGDMLSINIATILSWILAVIFAYVTNKKYVFKTTTNKKETIKECYEFVKYRLVVLFLDLFFMWLFVQIFNMNDMVAKLINQVIIIVVNYIFSKLFIFKKEG